MGLGGGVSIEVHWYANMAGKMGAGNYLLDI